MQVDLMKPSTQEYQTEMMTMMMQLDRLPQLSGEPYSNSSELPGMEFSGGSAAAAATTTPIFHCPSLTSTPLTNLSFPTTFLSAPVQEPMTSPVSGTSYRVCPTIRSLSPSTDAHQINFEKLLYSDCSKAQQGRPTWHEASENLGPLLTSKRNSMEAMREMIFRMAVMQPIQIDPEAVKPPKRRNVKISRDPQSVAARHRRERISERIRVLQRLVPGGTKMDTACMLDEAIHYVKFLKKQVQSLEQQGGGGGGGGGVGVGFERRAMVANVTYNSTSMVKDFPAYSNGGLYTNA